MRREYERLLEESLRERGYLRLYDVDVAFSTEYNDGSYDFTLSMFGVYVGKRVASCSVGISAGRVILKSEKSTVSTKSDQSSIPSV
jgi:hypothetical protein